MIEKLSTNIQNELNLFNDTIVKSLKTDIKDYQNVLEYIISVKGKQLRPILGIFIAKILGEFSDKQNKLLQAIELIHSATLFHDDIIDESDIRRNKPTLHKKFSNKIAILSGDYFLSVALKIVFDINNQEINLLVANYMKKICEGEIAQNLMLNKIISLEEYLLKTNYKTALLFELTTLGMSILSDKSKFNEQLRLFGQNFGMFFQINDDLKNFQNKDNKPVLNDLESGVVTAPIIYLAQDNASVEKLLQNKQYNDILDLLNKSDAILKTKNLMNDYLNKCIDILKALPNNKYNDLLSDFICSLY